MDLGSYYVPDKRFSTTVLSDLKLIYDRRKMEETKSSDLSVLFGYKHATATPFYHRLNSLLSFGLLEGRGSFKVTELGQKILFPENNRDDAINKSKAILNVPLWKALYDKFKKSLPADKLWVDLKNIAGVEPEKAQDVEEQIKKWYNEDIVHVSENIEKSETETLRSSSTQNNQMSQQMIVPEDSYGRVQLSKGGYIDVTDEATLEIAKSYIKVLEKKIQEKKSHPNIDPFATIAKPNDEKEK